MKPSRVRRHTARVAAILLLAALCGASDTEYSRKSLKGLPGVYGVVEELADPVTQDGLNKQDIQTDVELKLRLAGVKVLTEKEHLAIPGMPDLYVRVTPLFRDNLYAFWIEVDLEQNILLQRDQTIVVGATTWSEARIGMIGKNRLSEIRNDIKDLIDKFLNAYFSVNPKK
jgi:hypothetical protein